MADAQLRRLRAMQEVYESGHCDGEKTMRERAAKYMEMRADLIKGDDDNMTAATISRIYLEEAANLRNLPIAPETGGE